MSEKKRLLDQLDKGSYDTEDKTLIEKLLKALPEDFQPMCIRDSLFSERPMAGEEDSRILYDMPVPRPFQKEKK